MIEEIGASFSGRVALRTINADEAASEVSALKVHAIPTVIAFHDGIEVARVTGMLGRERLKALFTAALTGSPAVRTIANPRWLLVAGIVGLLAVATRAPLLLAIAVLLSIPAFRR